MHFIAALILGAPSAWGATLAEHVDAAVERAPALMRDRGRIEATRSRVEGARKWLKQETYLELSQLSDRALSDIGIEEQELSLSTGLWRPGERAAAVRFNEAAQSAAVAELQMEKLAVAGEVRSRYWNVVRRKRVAALQAQVVADATAMRDVVAGLVAAREAPPSDLRLAEAALAETAAAAALARIDAARATFELQALSGIDAVDDDFAAEAMVQRAADTEVHPLVALAIARRAAAERAVQLAKRQTSAGPEIALLWRRERPSYGAEREDSVGVRLRIPLGTRRESRAERAEWTGEAEATALELDQARAAAQAAIAAARRDLDGSAEAAAFEERRRNDLEQIERAVETAYREREASFLELLRARQSKRAAERGLIEAKVRHAEAVSALRQALGEFP